MIKFKKQSGQVLILFALAIVILIAVAGLLLDAGQAFKHRRAAQAAADAAALAGAYDLCYGGKTVASAQGVAQNYAVLNNVGLASPAQVNVADKRVDVTTALTQKPFFLQILGVGDVTVTAHAAAGCFPPGLAQHVLPTAWSCSTPLLIPGSPSQSEDCDYVTLDYPTQIEPILNNIPVTIPDVRNGVDTNVTFTNRADFKTKLVFNRLFVIMDNVGTSEEYCLPAPGSVNCDLNGDGRLDLLGGGDRSWLDLDGMGGGAGGIDGLKGWIENGYSGNLYVHQWLVGQDGVETATFNTVYDYQLYNVVLVPVFDALCPGDPATRPACIQQAHNLASPLPSGNLNGDTVVHSNGTFHDYFHIIAFAPFFITCVEAGSHKNCPGHDAAVSIGGMDKNTKTIEGYFVSNYPLIEIGGSGGADLGIYIISLIE